MAAPGAQSEAGEDGMEHRGALRCREEGREQRDQQQLYLSEQPAVLEEFGDLDLEI